MSKHILKVGTEEEVASLADWLDTHADDEDMPENAGEASHWLGTLEVRAGEEIEVPAELVEAVDWVIDDWSEVLGSHNEDLVTLMYERA
jgi:hypothetical protein